MWMTSLIQVTALLTPDELYVCPSEAVNFSCMIPRQQSDTLRWRVNFNDQSISSIERSFIDGLDNPGLTRQDTNNVGQEITFRLISVSLFITSTMTATIKDNPEYRQISISCNSGSRSAATADSNISTVFIISQAPTLDPNVTLTITDYQEQWFVVRFHWKQHMIPAQYSVSWSSAHMASMTTTSNNSVQLLLSYNAEYNISVVASNCGGTSAPIGELFRIGQCLPPIVGSNVELEGYISRTEGSQIGYRCQFGFQPIVNFNVSTCLSSGMWSPNPTDYNCTALPYSEMSCAMPVTQRSVVIDSVINLTIGATIVYYCNDSISHTDAAMSVCVEGGKWIPNTTVYSCEDSPNVKGKNNSVAAIAASAAIAGVILVLILCSVGVFLFWIVAFRRAGLRKQTRSNVDVVYDEIYTLGMKPTVITRDQQVTLNDNSAYCTIAEEDACKNEDEYMIMN